MTIDIKICGLSTPGTIDAAINAGATHVGLVHHAASPRHVDLTLGAELRQHVGTRAQTVLLLANADVATTAKAVETIRPDIVQFHGTERPEWIDLVRKQMGIRTWKALGLRNAGTLERSAKYLGTVDMLLFDAPQPRGDTGLPGGNGISFDWSLMRGHKHQAPWGLAGGLNPSNVAQAIAETGAPLVDASSGIESAPGVKDVDKIAAFCQAARNAAP